MQLAEIEDTVTAILARELGLDPADVGPETSVENNQLWDSVKHVDIVFSLQDMFEVEFDEVEMQEMLSYDQILDVLKKKLDGFAPAPER